MRNPLTMRRWNLNPFQMWLLLFLGIVSFSQMLVFAHHIPGFDESARQAAFSLAFCNFVGGLICFGGLHLRDRDTALWVELCGYVALTGSLGIYTYIVWYLEPGPPTSYGIGMCEAFILASMHRAALIVVGGLRRRKRTRQAGVRRYERLIRALAELEEDRRKSAGEEE